MSILIQDMKHAVRSFARTPGFTLLALLTLALGIGANTAIFSVLNGVMLEPLGYPEPNRLMMITSQFPTLGFDQFWVDAPEFVDLQKTNRSFESVGAYTVGAVNLSAGDRPERITSATVSASLFDALGVAAFRGRGLRPEDNLPNTERVAVLSHELWRRNFGGDESVLGKTIEVQGVNRTIVGIMPPGFDIHDARAEIWLPLNIDPANPGSRGSHFLYMVGRLRDGVTLAQARAELQGLLRGWRDLAPNNHVPNDSTHRLQYEPLQDDIVGSARTALWVLQGAVGFVLLIACANLANLLLARAEVRHKEFAIRAALGAGRGRLLRQFAAEGIVLSVAGAVVGVALAWVGLRLLLDANPTSIPRSAEVGIDATVLLFTLGIAVVTGILFGLAPLLHLGQGSMSLALKEGGMRTTAGVSRASVRRGLVVVEIALAVMLVVGSGLLLRSVWNVMSVDSGFDRNNLSTFGVVIPAAKYQQSSQRIGFFQQLNTRLSAIPGVTAVAAMTGLPPSRQVNANTTTLEGYVQQPGEPFPHVDYYQFTTVDYVRAMGIPVVEGRAFGPGDVGTAPPALLVNEALAKRFYPNQSPIGRRVRPAGVPDSIWFTIIGVVKDVKQGGLDQPTGTELYIAYEQTGASTFGSPTNLNVVVRSTLPLATLAPSIRQSVAALDPSLPVVNLRTMDEVFSQSVASPRFIAQLLATFAALALLLAAIGTYGILSYTVTERRHEIGIRMALGADRDRVLGMVVAQGMKVAMVGLALGILGALALTRLVSTMLFEVAPTDPLTFGTVAVLITVVAAAACLVPARRATRVDPMVVLRDE
jgi:putative ABC transport system permease protein